MGDVDSAILGGMLKPHPVSCQWTPTIFLMLGNGSVWQREEWGMSGISRIKFTGFIVMAEIICQPSDTERSRDTIHFQHTCPLFPKSSGLKCLLKPSYSSAYLASGILGSGRKRITLWEI